MSIDNGFIKLDRKCIRGPIGNNANLLKFWVHLLDNASLTEIEVRINGVKKKFPPGSLVFGFRAFSDKLKIPIVTLHRYVKTLERKWNAIGTLSGTEGTVISIRKWDLYYGNGKRGGTPSGTISERKWNPNKNKEERIINTIDQSTVPVDQKCPFDFEKLYALYPRKLGKKKGFQTCKSKIKSQKQYESLEQAISNYASYCQKQKTESRFIKHFSTFMNCFEDWIDPIQDGKLERKKVYDL